MNKIISYFVCFISVSLLQGKVPLESLKPEVPIETDVHVAEVYKYYQAISNEEYDVAYTHLSTWIQPSLSEEEFKSLFRHSNGIFVQMPETILSVSAKIIDKKHSAKSEYADGKLIIGVKRKVSGIPPLVSVEWSNSFADLWIKHDSTYLVVPNAFTVLRKKDLCIIYKAQSIK